MRFAKRDPFVVHIGERVEASPGLTYLRRSCGPAHTVVHELRWSAGHGLEVRIMRNPTAHRDARCLERYGGADALATAARLERFTVLGFVNGNFFHDVPDGFESNGFLWSDAPPGSPRVIAPVESTEDRDYRGDRLLVFDGSGASDVVFRTGNCQAGRCGSTLLASEAFDVRGLPTDLGDADLVSTLRSIAPTMTAAMQLTPALEDSSARSANEPSTTSSAFVRCSREHAWTCRPHSVTFVCVRPDHGVSLLAVEKTEYEPVVLSMRVGETCGTDCRWLYLLDGGGSTQVGIGDPRDGRLRVIYAGKYDPEPTAGCPAFRPVDHYVVVGRRE